MSFSEILAEIKDKQSKLKLTEQLCDNACKEYKRYEKICTAKEKSKEGTIWIIAGLIALILAVSLTISYFKHGGELTLGGLIVSAFVILLVAMLMAYGINLHIEASEYNYKEALKEVGGEEVAREAMEKALNEWRALEKELLTQKAALEKLTRYDGKDWDMKHFTATPENVQAMERDLGKLFISVHYIRPSEGLLDNWVCKRSMLKFLAMIQKDEEAEALFAASYAELKNSKSWKLGIAAFLMAALDLAMLHAAQGQKAPSFTGLVEKSTFRKPETDEEKEFFDWAVGAWGSYSVLLEDWICSVMK